MRSRCRTCRPSATHRLHREHGDLDGPDVVYIERCRTSRSGQREIDLNLHVGSRLPAYCTAMGKALLAFVPPTRLEEILDQTELVARGPNTITDRAALRAEMERVRTRAWP